jgi:hypothetical protein|nr:MAG: hypothetical protein TU36_07205 [Vulcanisaeta sp. AZ3]
MAKGIPAYALGGLIILIGSILSISLILSIPSPITTVTGYLNLTANAYLGIGNELLVIIGTNNFNLPITNLNIYIPRTGTNITINTEIPSGSNFLIMIYQEPNSTTIIAPGLSINGSPGNLMNMNKTGRIYIMNTTALVNNEAKRHGVFQVGTQISSILVAIPYIGNVSRPIMNIYIFQMIPMGTTTITQFKLASLVQQGVQEIVCNLSMPITLTSKYPTYMAINISSSNGTITPLNTPYICNASASSLPTLLYLELALKYNYNYNAINVGREDWFPVYIIPMQLSNT